MKTGMISTAAMNATLAKTKVQKSKMTTFESKVKDEGNKSFDGHAHFGTNQINNKAVQKDRAPAGGSMPSRKTGGKATGIIGSGNRSQSKQGGRVDSSYVPGRAAINEFPAKGAGKPWPASTGVKASKGFTGNTRMKGGPKPKSGGPYGGPSSRAGG